MTAVSDRPPDAGSFRGRLVRVRELLARPLFSYHLLLGVSALLMALGLMMVLSASSIHALQTRQSAFALFGRQFISMALGLFLMWICARLPLRFFRQAGYPLMVFAALGLILVMFIGSAEQGAQRWIYIGELTIQPSEPAKLALVLWGADLLAKGARAGQIEWRRLLIPLMPGLAIMAVLVMLGRDLGTTLVLMMIFLALLWVVGAPLKLFGGILSVMVLATVTMITIEGYRSARIKGWLDPWGNAQDAGYQLVQGQIGMGSGGWFGLGLGASRQKWNWTPHAESDFIFSILGEELGLMGTLVVVALFGLLGYAGLRVATRVRDPFVRLASVAAIAWIVGQAIVNIGAVIGVLPITGIPLPLISYGGSALLPTLAALGMLLAFAKQEPGAREALAARGPGPVARGLSWLGLGGLARRRRPATQDDERLGGPARKRRPVRGRR
ncbi:putative lipid II flippase FtsW [Streptosporangium roseum]|uniref:Probable peptidoglycan glycosyltransferase FtsW n=1 Tax=Streptosporangium roseum (strain ATCC 12428 / DSM 43021 / JCM 3005 / KCTC 9067 / NCIMB 10171 / NRRL 2505 / NI 9100) TaxID=479432 RepID=D2B836_STRRD|nr:putative lipid II flippase FtsW [Streptosporangium roseum]ACZ85826.1 cell division membrane protein-like protein [Streptosporangium roseum DSM 43021]